MIKHLLPFSSKILCAQYGFEETAKNNRVEVVEFLIEAGLPDPEDTYTLGLNIAAEQGYEQLVRTILWAIVRTGHAPRDFGRKAMLTAATAGNASIVKSVLEFANKASYPEEGLVAALRNDHDEVADMIVRRANLDHVRDLIADKEIEAKLDEAIVRVGATKQHRELQSNERNRARDQAKLSNTVSCHVPRVSRL